MQAEPPHVAHDACSPEFKAATVTTVAAGARPPVLNNKVNVTSINHSIPLEYACPPEVVGRVERMLRGDAYAWAAGALSLVPCDLFGLLEATRSGSPETGAPACRCNAQGARVGCHSHYLFRSRCSLQFYFYLVIRSFLEGHFLRKEGPGLHDTAARHQKCPCRRPPAPAGKIWLAPAAGAHKSLSPE